MLGLVDIGHLVPHIYLVCIDDISSCLVLIFHHTAAVKSEVVVDLLRYICMMFALHVQVVALSDTRHGTTIHTLLYGVISLEETVSCYYCSWLFLLGVCFQRHLNWVMLVCLV